MSQATPEHVEKTKTLQSLWLDQMIKMMDPEQPEFECSATDRATIYRFLSDNGWTVDPSNMPTGLKDLLTSRPEFDDGEEEVALAVVR